MQAGVVAAKSFDRAKARFGPDYGPEDRADIARALFEDQLVLCLATPQVRWWVVSDDETVLARARAEGLGEVRDQGAGLNEAFSVAVEAVTQVGATSVLLMPADLPLVRPSDIQDVLDTAATSDVVVVPSDDGGTNALCLEPPGVLAPRFGPYSLREHMRAAEEAKVRCALLPIARMALDLDTPGDVEELFERDPDGLTATATVLRRLASAR